MQPDTVSTRRRGRPPKDGHERGETRDVLCRAGIEVLTEKGFSATGIDEILRRVAVPKGSFYHYFDSKEAFGAALIDQYGAYFARKLDRHLLDHTRAPLARIRSFIEDAQDGMARHGYQRGCLIGNLGQEMGTLPVAYRAQLMTVFTDWQSRLSRCLNEAITAGEISPTTDCDQWAAFFWIGWEGAVLRAKLERKPDALDIFTGGFFAALPVATQATR